MAGAARGRLGWEAPGGFEEPRRDRAAEEVAGDLGRKGGQNWQAEASSRPRLREGSGSDRAIGSTTLGF